MQFKTLYHEFLFRLVDLELLSPDAQGDANRLLGRFGTLLAFFSIYLGLTGFLFDHKGMPLPMFRTISWTAEHFFISTTMLIVGLFAVPQRNTLNLIGHRRSRRLGQCQGRKT